MLRIDALQALDILQGKNEQQIDFYNCTDSNHLPDLCFLDICHLKQANIRMITKKANAMDGTIITANGVVIDVSDAGKIGTFS